MRLQLPITAGLALILLASLCPNSARAQTPAAAKSKTQVESKSKPKAPEKTESEPESTSDAAVRDESSTKPMPADGAAADRDGAVEKTDKADKAKKPATPPAKKPVPQKPQMLDSLKSNTNGKGIQMSGIRLSEVDGLLLSFYDPQNQVMPEKEPEIEAIVEKYPKNTRALVMLAQLDQNKGRRKTDGKSDLAAYKRAAEYMRRAIATLKKKDQGLYDYYAASIFYDEACAYSQEEDEAAALTALRLSAEHGWTNVTHMQEDKDLEFIRENEEFAKIAQLIEAQNKRKK
jgi:hypothetical protein